MILKGLGFRQGEGHKGVKGGVSDVLLHAGGGRRELPRCPAVRVMQATPMVLKATAKSWHSAAMLTPHLSFVAASLTCTPRLANRAPIGYGSTNHEAGGGPAAAAAGRTRAGGGCEGRRQGR